MATSDLYTKAVLTIIAFGLLWVGFTLNTRTAEAQGGPTRVVITGVTSANGVLPVGIAAVGWENPQYGGTGNWKHDPLPVAVANTKPLAVAIAKEQSAPQSK